jgi:hypothetical protein
MKTKRLDFQIDPKILDELITIQNKLPGYATRANVEGGAEAYDHPAGLALLGLKDDIIDTVVPLKMSGGCWDAPNINHEDMYKGLMKLIDTGRMCSGMALIRHPKWDTHGDEGQVGTMPTHLKSQLHGLRKSFEDITRTAWIVLHNDYFRVYRPTRGTDGRIGAREIKINSLFPKEAFKEALIKAKMDRDNARLARKKAAAEAKKKREKEYLDRIKAEEEKVKKKSEGIDTALKEGKQSIIDIGGGMVFMRQKDGKYILWQTGRHT